MSETVGDDLVARLAEWGIDTIFGYPGDGINGFLGALERAGDRIRFVQTRHEEMAAFMACAWAKYTGKVGICTATSGPGAIHLLNGLYDAKLDHQPVVAIVGQTNLAAIGGDQQQEVDILSLYKDVASAYVQQVSAPGALHHCLDRALRIADAEHTVTALIIPADVQEMKAVPLQPKGVKAIHSGVGFARPRIMPLAADLDRAATILNTGKKVAILVGAGALDATDEVLAVADVLGAGIAKALLGKAAVPDDTPGCTGSIGLLGTKPSWAMMQRCDTLLVVGSGFPYSNFLPPVGQARAVQIDHSPRAMSLRYPMDVLLCGDAKSTLTALLPRLKRQSDRSWRDGIVEDVKEWWTLMDKRAEPEQRGDRIRPQALFGALSQQLPDNAILSADSGSVATWYAQHVRLRRGMKATLSGGLATMLPGVPYAIAAKFAYPGRVAIALVGDGAMQMGGMAEMLTAAKYYGSWSDPRLIVLVLNNADLNMVTWEQRVLAGDPKFTASQELPDVAYERWAEMIGLVGIRVDRAEDIDGAWRQAFAANRPVIINALTDPEEPPFPPHVTLDQSLNFGRSVIKGDPLGLRDVVTAARDKLGDLLPGSAE
jgi:pyruvate dehydrogenase (quinone)